MLSLHSFINFVGEHRSPPKTEEAQNKTANYITANDKMPEFELWS